MKLEPSKYTPDELKLCIDQDCSIMYYGEIIKGKIISIYHNGFHDLITVKPHGLRAKEGFFVERVITVPLLDKLRTKRLWNLIK